MSRFLGKTHKQEAKDKVSNAVSKELKGKIGSNARRWKGNRASYVAKHMWIIKHYGKADLCDQSNCTFKSPKRYEWHNISGEYLRDREDYVRLCPSCHRRIHKGSLKLCVA